MKKYVLTGAPSSGKSSIILSLEYEKKQPVIREAAEDVIKLYQAKGITEPWKLNDFQDKILELQLQRENLVNKKNYDEVFIDRGILDGLAYYQMMERKPSELIMKEMKKLEETPYEKIFLIEMINTYEKNLVRREQQEEAKILEQLQEKNYKAQGYEVIKIKNATVEERIKQILKHI